MKIKCDRCGTETDPDKLKTYVRSTRHLYKNRNDNPIVMSVVSFKMVDSKKKANLCPACQLKTIREIWLGGNFE